VPDVFGADGEHQLVVFGFPSHRSNIESEPWPLRSDRSIGGLFGSIGGFGGYSLRSPKKSNLKARYNAEKDRRDNQPESENRDRVGEQKIDEAPKRMLFFGPLFLFRLSDGLLFAWVSGLRR
jgi:hypothetical protein